MTQKTTVHPDFAMGEKTGQAIHATVEAIIEAARTDDNARLEELRARFGQILGEALVAAGARGVVAGRQEAALLNAQELQ